MRVNPDALRDMREARGLSLSDLQVEVSALRGKKVALSYLSEMENGYKPGSPQMVRLLADALKCSTATLLLAPEREREAT